LWHILGKRTHLKELGLDGKGTLNWNFKKLDEKAWTGLIWLRMQTGSGVL
jgi:hypothetical protein